MRPALCEDALRLGRVLQGLAPQEPEVHGLAALMEIQASRTAARVGPKGEVIPLTEQNRAAWDGLLIQRGLDALTRAEKLGRGLGPYGLQAAIAACHARARTAADTDWAGIADHYRALAEIAPSPGVELNRAVALAYAYGPARGLEAVERLSGEPALQGYYLLPAVRGDLLFKLGRFGEAAGEFARAAELTRNEREQAFLRARAAACMWGNHATDSAL
jgi:predicted RNA polymerase sigma factor